MRFFKNRPLLAALIVVGLVGAASGAVYAVDRVFLTIDPEESAPQIEQDVKDQLEQAGVTGTVHAEKDGSGAFKIQITTTDKRIGSAIDVELPTLVGSGAVKMQRRERVEVHATLTDAQQKQLLDAMGDNAFHASLIGLDADAEMAAFKTQLAAHGFHDVTVELAGDDLSIVVNAAPTE